MIKKNRIAKYFVKKNEIFGLKALITLKNVFFCKLLRKSEVYRATLHIDSSNLNFQGIT